MSNPSDEELLALINKQIDLLDQYKNRNWFDNPPKNDFEEAMRDNCNGEV